MPQVSEGAHYIGVFLNTDSGVFNIPIWNLQLMIDGRNLQGGLSAEPPHAEVKEYQCYINTTPWLEKSKDMFISINSNEEIINNSVIEVLNSNYILSNIDKSSTTIKENIIIDLVEI